MRRSLLCRPGLLLAAGLLVPSAMTGGSLPGAVGAPAKATSDGGSAQLELPADATEVAGTDPGAPDTVPAGWSRTELPGEPSARYFTYSRTITDSAVYVSLSGTGSSPTSAETFRLEVSTADGTTCDSNVASRTEGDRGLAVTAVGIFPDGPDDESTTAQTCREAASLRITVERSSFNESDAASDVWIRVVEEAPLAEDARVPRAQDKASSGAVDVGGEAEDRPGSTDIATAPLIETGIYRGTVPAGGQVAYRVRLDFGQTLYAEAVAAALSPQQAEESSYGASLGIAVLSPLLSSADTTGGSDTLGSDPARARGAAGPIAYANRYEFTGPPAVAGEYLIVITFEVDDGVDLDEVDYTLRASVDGDAQAPDFASTPPYLAGADRADLIELSPARVEDEDAGSTLARYAGGGGLVAVGLVAVVAGLVMLRRRQASTST